MLWRRSPETIALGYVVQGRQGGGLVFGVDGGRTRSDALAARSRTARGPGDREEEQPRVRAIQPCDRHALGRICEARSGHGHCEWRACTASVPATSSMLSSPTPRICTGHAQVPSRCDAFRGLPIRTLRGSPPLTFIASYSRSASTSPIAISALIGYTPMVRGAPGTAALIPAVIPLGGVPFVEPALKDTESPILTQCCTRVRPIRRYVAGNRREDDAHNRAQTHDLNWRSTRRCL